MPTQKEEAASTHSWLQRPPEAALFLEASPSRAVFPGKAHKLREGQAQDLALQPQPTPLRPPTTTTTTTTTMMTAMATADLLGRHHGPLLDPLPGRPAVLHGMTTTVVTQTASQSASPFPTATT
jgi:hypothetical protein